MEFLKFLESIRTPIITTLFQLTTYLGEELFVLSVICCLYWCLNKQLAYKIGFTYFASGLLVQTLKITFRIPRPWILDPTLHPVESAIPAATGYSFPSGHTQSGTALFASLGLHLRHSWMKLSCIALFLLVGLSRLYLGVHTPKDVLVSMGLTLIIAYLIHKVIGKLTSDHSSDKKISLILAFISLSVLIFSLIMQNMGIIDMHYASDCCKAAGAGLGFAVGWYIERTYIRFGTKTAIFKQLLKFFIGIAVSLILKLGLKEILGTSIPADIFRYFILVLWVIALYPMLFKKYV